MKEACRCWLYVVSSSILSEKFARCGDQGLRKKRLYSVEIHIRNIAYPKDGNNVNAKKYVYFFGDGKAEGSVEMKSLLGSKEANLAEMVNIGIPVPQGFTISTEACTHYYASDGGYPDGLEDEVDENFARLEESTKKRFGDAKNPLPLSMRSGAAISMPGMADAVLNIGLNDESVAGIAKSAGNERFAYDSYRRFMQMFGNVVVGMEHSNFEQILEEKKRSRGVTMDAELDADDLKDLVSRYKEPAEKEIVVDCTLNEVGAKDKSLYNRACIKAMEQSGTDHELAETLSNAHANYDKALGCNHARVFPHNIAKLSTIISAFDTSFGDEKLTNWRGGGCYILYTVWNSWVNFHKRTIRSQRLSERILISLRNFRSNVPSSRGI